MSGSMVLGQGTAITADWMFTAGGARPLAGWGVLPGVLPPLGLPGDPAWWVPLTFPGLAELLPAALPIQPPAPFPLFLPDTGAWPAPPPLLPEAGWTPRPDQPPPGTPPTEPEPPTPGNQAPVLAGGDRQEIEVPEALSLPARLLAAFDPEGDFFTWRVEGGADADLLRIDPGSGEIAFRIAPDFERPGDADGDNRYEIVVRVDDIWGGTDAQLVIIRVTDSAETVPDLPAPPDDEAPARPLPPTPPPVEPDMLLGRGDAFAIGLPIPADALWM